MNRLAILISDTGTGTNLQAIIDAIEEKRLNAIINVVVSDTEFAKGLSRAQSHDLPTKIVGKKANLSLLLTQTYPVDYVCLAGWKQIIPANFIDTFPKKILNLHPGLIPDKKNGVVKNPDDTDGLWNQGMLTEKAIRNFLESNASYAGSSVHFLTHEFDFGPVLGRTFEKIAPNDTIDSLYQRLKKKENALYVAVLQKLCK